MKAQHVSSGTPLIIRSSKLYLQPLVHIPMWWPAVVSLDNGRSPHGYINQRLQIQFRVLMMSGVPLETCWAFSKLWNNKFYYKTVYFWYFYWVILRCTDPWILKSSVFICNKWFCWRNITLPKHADRIQVTAEKFNLPCSQICSELECRHDICRATNAALTKNL